MNRLTQRNPTDNGYFFPECFERCGGNPKDCSDCDFNIRLCEALAAYEDTGLSPGQIHKMYSVNIHNPNFADVEEILNDEISKVVDILRASPMFTGRITLAMEISNEGNSVRPILYPSKYTPKEQAASASPLPGQITFDD